MKYMNIYIQKNILINVYIFFFFLYYGFTLRKKKTDAVENKL